MSEEQENIATDAIDSFGIRINNARQEGFSLAQAKILAAMEELPVGLSIDPPHDQILYREAVLSAIREVTG